MLVVCEQRATITPNWNRIECEVATVTAHYVTFKMKNRNRSEPLSWIELSWDILPIGFGCL